MHTSFLLVIRHLRSYIARSVFVRMYIRSTIESHLNGQAAIRRTSHSFDASVIVPTFTVNFPKARSLSASISMSLSISRQTFHKLLYFTLSVSDYRGWYISRCAKPTNPTNLVPRFRNAKDGRRGSSRRCSVCERRGRGGTGEGEGEGKERKEGCDEMWREDEMEEREQMRGTEGRSDRERERSRRKKVQRCSQFGTVCV